MSTLNPMSDQFISSLSSATSLTVPDGTQGALIQAIGQNVRFRVSTAPTAVLGGVIYTGECRDFAFGKVGLARLQFIEETGGGQLFVIYYK